jgi:phosphate transport system substrate-binding protein
MIRLNGRPAFCVLWFCVLVVLTSMAGCGSSASSAASLPSTTRPSTTRPPSPSGSPGESPACATGAVHLIGSTAFMPIAQDAAKAYMSSCPSTSITVTGGDSDYGLTQVQDAVKAGSPSAGSMIAMYDGLPSGTAGLSPYPMGVLILSVVAHTGLFSTGNISTAELIKIFIKPGEQGKVAVGRRAGSGTRRAFDNDVLGRNPGAPDKGNCPSPTGATVSFTSCTEDSTPHLLSFVNETPNAIGYAAVPQPDTTYPQVSVLSIDSFTPTADNVRNEQYNFWVVENLYASTNPTVLTKDFLNFLSHYIDPNLPSDFIPCYAAPKSLGTGC